MRKIITSSLILMATSLPIAMAQPPLSRATAGQTTPLLTKAALKQELRWTLAYKKPVRVGALMTKREKRAFFHAMRMARTMEARQQVRELTYARLRQRVIERGMFVVMPNTTANVARTEAKPQIRETVREPVRVAVKPTVVRVAAAPAVTPHVAAAPAVIPHLAPPPAVPHPSIAPAHPVRLPLPPKH